MMKALTAALTLLIATSSLNNLSAQRPHEPPTIYTINKDGINPKPFINIPDMQWHGNPSWSPDGKRIVFDASPRWRTFWLSHIYVCDSQGKNVKDFGPGDAAAWSPDGKTIAYHIYEEASGDDPAGVWLMNFDGTNKRWLCEGNRPRWSPDGKQLVVTRYFPSTLYVVIVKTRKEERVLHEHYHQVPGADFSPDGKSIVFIGYREKFLQGELGLLTKKDKKWSFRVRHEGGMGYVPSWSPDGKRILFYTVTGGNQRSRQLHTISVKGKDEPLRLTSHDDVIYNTDASWSPDGKKVIFARAH